MDPKDAIDGDGKPLTDESSLADAVGAINRHCETKRRPKFRELPEVHGETKLRDWIKVPKESQKRRVDGDLDLFDEVHLLCALMGVRKGAVPSSTTTSSGTFGGAPQAGFHAGSLLRVSGRIRVDALRQHFRFQFVDGLAKVPACLKVPLGMDLVEVYRSAFRYDDDPDFATGHRVASDRDVSATLFVDFYVPFSSLSKWQEYLGSLYRPVLPGYPAPYSPDIHIDLTRSWGTLGVDHTVQLVECRWHVAAFPGSISDHPCDMSEAVEEELMEYAWACLAPSSDDCVSLT